jgi:hypothetical protein
LAKPPISYLAIVAVKVRSWRKPMTKSKTTSCHIEVLAGDPTKSTRIPLPHNLSAYFTSIRPGRTNPCRYPLSSAAGLPPNMCRNSDRKVEKSIKLKCERGFGTGVCGPSWTGGLRNTWIRLLSSNVVVTQSV